MNEQTEPKCRSCGTTWVNHLGPEGTCRRLRELMAAARRLLYANSLVQEIEAGFRLRELCNRIDAEDAEYAKGPKP